MKRLETFHKEGRVSRIEWIADRLGLNRIFLRRPPVKIRGDVNHVTSPAHARVETLTKVSKDGTFEEKGTFGKERRLHLRDIVKETSMLEEFSSGDYLKLYLAPWDLHFLLFPVGGRVVSYLYHPGKILPLLFFRSGDVQNERLSLIIKTEFGIPLALVMIGSFLVNGIHHDFVEGTSYERGDRLGHFKIGSSVVMVFPPGRIDWICQAGDKLRIGDPIGRIL